MTHCAPPPGILLRSDLANHPVFTSHNFSSAIYVYALMKRPPPCHRVLEVVYKMMPLLYSPRFTLDCIKTCIFSSWAHHGSAAAAAQKGPRRQQLEDFIS
jgi:hypothetical protein